MNINKIINQVLNEIEAPDNTSEFGTEEAFSRKKPVAISRTPENEEIPDTTADNVPQQSGIGMAMGLDDEKAAELAMKGSKPPSPGLLGKIKGKFEDMSPTSKYALAAAAGIGAGIGALKLAQKLRAKRGFVKK